MNSERKLILFLCGGVMRFKRSDIRIVAALLNLQPFDFENRLVLFSRQFQESSFKRLFDYVARLNPKFACHAIAFVGSPASNARRGFFAGNIVETIGQKCFEYLYFFGQMFHSGNPAQYGVGTPGLQIGPFSKQLFHIIPVIAAVNL
jgi:hypothetical protein